MRKTEIPVDVTLHVFLVFCKFLNQGEVSYVEDIERLQTLAKAFFQLPSNYNFEIPKTIWKIRSTGSKCGKILFVGYDFRAASNLRLGNSLLLSNALALGTLSFHKDVSFLTE